ncbi:MAG: HAMP domain-containing histidine kinase [Gemmatimonadales bacterium]|nr:HAMP domain-containing histidine kinase [Gemmatimonadales bacterium]
MSQMKYQGKKVRFIVLMITVSLAGLMAVQLRLLNIAWELKDQAFQRNVVTALTITAQKLEAGEMTEDALEVIYKFGTTDTLVSRVKKFGFHLPDGHLADSLNAELDTAFINIEAHLPVETSSPSRQMTFIVADGRTELIQRIVGDLLVQEPRPIRKRLDRAEIDSLLRINLDAVGIDLVPDFGVIATGNDSLVLASTDGYLDSGGDKLLKSRFRSRLFPLDLTPDVFEIALHFPGHRGFLLNQIWPLLAASILFTLLIVTAFVLALGMVDKQRRFAGRMVDFINNMTHEFKTPISTVSLASEAIARQDILEQPEALQRYNRMIRDENQRMRRQVEKILQIAQLEAGDFSLSMAPIDCHELVAGAAEAFALQIEKRGGTLSLDLAADRVFVRGDPVHLANVLANLLDNAIKYSPDAPVIGLTTRNNRNLLILEVTDQGIGIDKQDRDRVFEKYYRCPTGDRHDVKGYGLGLSYVRLLMEAHGGHVKLGGSPNQGTHVTLALPLDEGDPQPGSEK